MPDIMPFGSDTSKAEPNLGQQIFLGLTVESFNCNSSWSPEGGQCNITLVQDPQKNQTLENVIVGSPQYFEIIDLDNTPIFRFYGILKKISRSVDTSSKKYQVVLQSPTIIADACSLILSGFAGYGGAIEGHGGNISSCLNFGSNNMNHNPDNIFNIQNVFGFYENDSFGGVNNAGFGESAVTEEGIRVEYLAYALDQLINGGYGTPKLGGNIIYGADAYSNTNAYYYNFDILGFFNSIKDRLPNDYRISPGTSNLMEVIDGICNLINHVYFLDLLKPSDKGSSYFSGEHVATPPTSQTHANTVYGGQIIVITQDRNVFSGTKFPLSSYVIGKEISDKVGGNGQDQDLPLDIGLTGSAHPDGSPVSIPPMGGLFPVEPITMNKLQDMRNSDLGVALNEGAVGAKYITGGFQSRINYVKSIPHNNRGLDTLPPIDLTSTCTDSPVNIDNTQDVYMYWGEINTSARLLGNNVWAKNPPVLTPLMTLNVNPINSPNPDGYLNWRDFIFIDVFDIVGDLTIAPCLRNGVYVASLWELYYASMGIERWLWYMNVYKYTKIGVMETYFQSPSRSPYRPMTGYLAAAVSNGANHQSGFANTIASNTASESCTRDMSQFSQALVKKLKDTYDAHYGKTYAVKMPSYSLKANPDYTPDEVESYYTYSWNTSTDGFLDPLLYEEYSTPQGNFLNNGRISTYVNFETNILNTERFIHNGKVYNTTTDAIKHRDFRAYQMDQMYSQYSPYDSVQNIVSIPATVEPNYRVLPYTYFQLYNAEIFSTTDIRPNVDIEVAGPLFTFISQLVLPQIADSTKGAVFSIVNLSSAVGDYFYSQGPTCSTGDSNSDDLRSNFATSLTSVSFQNPDRPISPAHPVGFGIPQQSNRYVYGPWITNTTLNYGLKFEYEQKSDLVPENYLNFATLNTIGQLYANSVENFDYIYTEEGSITLAGLPKVTNLGKSLIEGGPLISDIAVNISPNEITTQYNMKTFAPKFGKMGNYVANKITKIISRLK
jgi:hypothetical protein